MPPPSHFGKYRVIASLGQGGMARVLLTVAAGKAGFEKLLVVKELREELAHDPEFLTMFLDEARLAARLNHPNVVQTYEVGQDGDRHYIAMDYLEGQSLVGLVRKVSRARMPLDLHVRVLEGTLAGLDYAHTLADFDGSPLSIVHRDVSPHNVFITYSGQVKVVDFGIAKAVGAATQTRTGVFKGKPGYIAPEQARAQRVDGRADVFAVGVMLWEALARDRLATGDSDLAVIALRLSGEERRIREVRADVPEELAAICEKAMALDPADRFESAAAMRDALDAWLDTQPKRASAKELGAYLQSVFESERTALRARIDEQLKLARDASVDSPLPVVELAAPAVGRADVTPSLRGPDEGDTQAATNVSGPRLRPSTSSGARGSAMRYLWMALTGSVVAIGATALLRRGGGAGDAPGAAPEDATKVSVSIAYGPEGAIATLDGSTLEGRPFRGKLPKDGAAHTLEVRAPGHVTERRMVGFERDLVLSIELQRESHAEPSAEPSTRPVASAAAPLPSGPALSPSAAPGPAGAAVAAPRTSGVREPPPPETSPKPPPPAAEHAIDDKNPYPGR